MCPEHTQPQSSGTERSRSRRTRARTHPGFPFLPTAPRQERAWIPSQRCPRSDGIARKPAVGDATPWSVPHRRSTKTTVGFRPIEGLRRNPAEALDHTME
ncbi:hypothetical protein GCM10009634_25860 [Saccharothrix xinjiangensis]